MFLGELLQDVAAIGNRAYGDHDKPSLEGIEVKRAKLAVGQYGQDDGGEKQKLGERENLSGRGAFGAGTFGGILRQAQRRVLSSTSYAT